MFFSIIKIFRRVISKEEGSGLAKDNDLIFIETSALTAENVQKAFEKIASRVLKKIDNKIIDPKIEV